jgi:hypothetical protein
MGALIPVLSSVPVDRQAPIRRIKALGKTLPYTFAAMSSPPSWIRGPANAALGVLAGGEVLRGTNPGDIAGMVAYTAGGVSTGTNIAGQDILTNAARGVWVPNVTDWTPSGYTAAVGSSSLRVLNRSRGQGPFCASFETDAPTVGVCAGLANAGSGVRMWVDVLDGAGYKDAAVLRPLPSVSGSGQGMIYCDFGSRVTRRIYLEVDQFFTAIVLRTQDTLTPYAPTKKFLRFAYIGDSIGYVLYRVGKKIGALPTMQWAVGGTGYSRQGGVKVGGGTPTSNADFDFAASTPSIAGNMGYNDGTRTEGALIDTTLLHIVESNPDVIVCAAGINDGAPMDIAPNYGWSVASGSALVWQYLRQRTSALLVCVDPWTGAARGADGLSPPGSRPYIRAAFDAIAGPTLSINNQDSTWRLKRADGSIVDGSTGSGPWLTGIGMVSAPTGVGNADLYVGDGTHPAAWASTTTTGSTTLPAATINVVAATSGLSNFPPSGTLSIQPAGPVSYPGQVVAYTGKTATSFTGCSGGTGTFPAGSNVYLYQTVPGEDYYGDKVAAALCAALAVL